ncbi:hypothetical protein HCN51_47690 [Nonomuraea sp. FMUSA5-5]|uniref:Uncharacterized protein n=1 Tax=Nonomuraea composti TaxID=2720023 RepID=A0ABX1BKH1_9ACTN|nr:hypothetical protein [Nonomuraea sp. FMUSA5-5]NJP97027.1 hypothetical protein [Nonomuraea sp. FMUSA5-5]
MSITDLRTTTQRQIAEMQPDPATRELLADDRVQAIMREIEGSLDHYTMRYQEKYRMLSERAAARMQESTQARQPMRAQQPMHAQQATRMQEPVSAGGYHESLGAPAYPGMAQQGRQGEQARIAEPGRAGGQIAGSRAAGMPEVTTPITQLQPPYLWFDLMAVGPYRETFQGGPLQPARVVRFGEKVVLFAVLWRNPMPLPGGPSAADVMAPYVFQVRGVTVDLNTVTPGPVLAPAPEAFNAGFFNIVPLQIPTAPQPADGQPRPLEIHLTVDILGVGVGLPPFAGFASRWFRPDLQPGFLGQPDILPGIVEESPVRMLIYA